jgi:hypothetical protein
MPSTNAKHRRNVLKIIGSVKRRMAALGQTWDVRGTTYEPHAEGPSKMGEWRDRRQEEYPENQPETWAHTAIAIDMALYELTILRDYAERNAGADHAAAIAAARLRLTEGE